MNEQGSPGWFAERCGHATASRFADALAKPKGASLEATSRKNYRMQLVTERLSGQAVEGFRNAATDWGTEQEKYAKALVEQELGFTIINTGFVKHPTIAWCGCSPDGLVDGGLLQVKCPFVSTNHVETIESDRVPTAYAIQIQGELLVTNRAFSWYVSYDPRMPPNLRLYMKRVERDEEKIEMIEREIRMFLKGVDSMHIRLANRSA